MATGKLKKRSLDATPDLVEALDAVMPVSQGSEADVTGYFDGRGKLRRVVAAYSNGWQVRVNVSANGDVTSTSASLKLVAKIGGAS